MERESHDHGHGHHAHHHDGDRGEPCCGGHHDHEAAVPDAPHVHDVHHAGAGAGLAELDRRFFDYVGIVLLAAWGAVMIYFFASGRVTHYLTGSGTFRIQCLLAGLALCVVAAFNLLTARRGAMAEAGHVDPTDQTDHSDDAGDANDAAHDDCRACDHDHAAEGTWLGKIVAFLILALPLTAAALYSPDRYSEEFQRLKVTALATTSTAAIGTGGVDLRKRAEKAPAPADGAATKPSTPAAAGAFTVEELERLSGGRSPDGDIRLQLVELFYMPAQTQDVKDVVASQSVETVGQAIKDTTNADRMRLFRLMMTCCAADARPISIPVEFDGPMPEWREMAWYKVIGHIEYRDENGNPTAVFKAKSLAPEKAPRNQMMF